MQMQMQMQMQMSVHVPAQDPALEPPAVTIEEQEVGNTVSGLVHVIGTAVATPDRVKAARDLIMCFVEPERTAFLATHASLCAHLKDLVDYVRSEQHTLESEHAHLLENACVALESALDSAQTCARALAFTPVCAQLSAQSQSHVNHLDSSVSASASASSEATIEAHAFVEHATQHGELTQKDAADDEFVLVKSERA